MAQQIVSQIKQLKEKDAQRRQLIAQVFHDLRTPLASMQGYIESLKLRRDRLTPEEQDRFLDIALKEGRRLSRLVDELTGRHLQPLVDEAARQTLEAAAQVRLPHLRLSAAALLLGSACRPARVGDVRRYCGAYHGHPPAPHRPHTA